MNDFVPSMRRRADLEKIALVTCRSELEKVKAINVELVAVLKKLRYALNMLKLDPVDSDYCSVLEQADMAISKAEPQ